ncbi:thioredoxin domain-containing protein 11-like [Uloborus diversus]|uniref:thioredoxin domain-containing protein 11-like n=1 Tax=Uloborus diversus TaxID=327109 RepID=UPI002409DB79|nr:thioredoxin domain-containing protein 11-like [Uloborus diversus]
MAANILGKDENDTQIHETRGDAVSLTKCIQVMNSYGREIIFVIALIFTGIAALRNGPLKTKKVTPPELFFLPPSLVTDFYQGNVKNLLSLLSEKDVSLVVYYAPWDASCLQFRPEIETVAKFYHNEIFFAAVNCWWPEGECSKKFNIVSYPVVLVHIHDVGIVRYEGPLISTYIISFLDYVLTPLVPLHHTGELLDLLTKHEAVLVAFFEFGEGSYPFDYTMFYTASLKALTTDPNRRICFAVITNKKDAINFKLKSNFQLFLWNSTEIYSENVTTHLEILKWAYGKLKHVSEWITPPGVKSKILAETIENKPTIILFTPRNILLEYSPYYSLFKEVALDYNNCKDHQLIKSLIHRLVLRRHVLQEELTKIIEKCHRNDSEHSSDICRRRPDLCDLTCCRTTNFKLKLTQTCLCRMCLHHFIENLEQMKLSECENTLELILKSFNVKELTNFRNCSDVEVSFPVKFGSYRQLSIHCGTELPSKAINKGLSEKEISELKDDMILAMIQNNEKRLCHRLRYALNYSELNFPSFPTSDNNTWQNNFSGLGCQTNRTLTFIAMDVILYHSFAENLGIDVSNNHHQTTAVIIETTQEKQYVLEGLINKKSLVEFIKNYTAGSLGRHFRTPIRKLDGCKSNENADICVEEISGATFSEIVLDETKDVVLMYYAPWCGPCSSIAHVFLSVADYFSNISDIKFARINGDENDLPWEYTVEKYPAIIFFPAKRKSESIEFPSNLMITVTSLMHFVLVHAQSKVRWLAAMEMCNRECVAHNLIMSSKEMRRLYREYRVLLNNFHFAEQIVYGPKKFRTSLSKNRTVKEPSLNYLKNVYLKDVIERIHEKRTQINKALQLLVILRKKRDAYLLNESVDKKNGIRGKKIKHVEVRSRKVKDEL